MFTLNSVVCVAGLLYLCCYMSYLVCVYYVCCVFLVGCCVGVRFGLLLFDNVVLVGLVVLGGAGAGVLLCLVSVRCLLCLFAVA